jgi:hypothetical protein
MTRPSTRRPSRRATRRGVVVSAVGALAVAAGLVWQSAYAGFSDTTPALSVGLGTGTVAVSNNVEGYGALSLPTMRPGDSATECVLVSSTGSHAAQVRLYGKSRSSTVSGTTLTSALTFSWTAGSGGGANGDCAGFVSNGTTVTTSMASFPTTYASAYLPWNTTGGPTAETRTYQLTYSLSANAPTSVKGQSAAITFVWEAQQR